MASHADLVRPPREATRPAPRPADADKTGDRLNGRAAVVAQRVAVGKLSAARMPVQRQLKTVAAPAHAPIQRAAHRADVGMQVDYNGHRWDVMVSAIGNPNIQLRRAGGNQIVNINWAQAVYTIVRANNANDHDLRENDPAAGIDAYAGLGSFLHNDKLRQNFALARTQALVMIKDIARPDLNNQGERNALRDITLDQFEPTVWGAVLSGQGKATEAVQWELFWKQGDQNNPRRTWHFVIDSDNPLATSAQEPHVGWTVSAAAGTSPVVGNTFGHVWVDFVPAMR